MSPAPAGHHETADDPEATAILDVWRTQLDAMDAGDTDALSSCCTRDMILTHMTGHRQPLPDWLDGIRRRTFVYHRLVERSVQITAVDGDRATLVGHVITGITDDGSGQAWRLRMEQDYRREAGEWLCNASRVSLG